MLVVLKNFLWPRSRAPLLQPDSPSSVNYGTLEELLTETPNTDDTTSASPFTLSQADTDVEAQEASDSESEEESRSWKLNPRVISDTIIGLSDGLTVPFALTAGLSRAGDTRLVVLAGLAELIAGAISMGLGGFIGAKSEAESYNATVCSAQALIRTSRSKTEAMIRKVFEPYNLTRSCLSTVIETLHGSPEKLLDFLMRFHYQQAEPDLSRPWVSAATIAGGYFFGGLVPLVPYFLVERSEVVLALKWSIGVMVVALFAFGYVKTGVVCGWSGTSNIAKATKSAGEMVLVGGTAAAAAVGMVSVLEKGR